MDLRVKNKNAVPKILHTILGDSQTPLRPSMDLRLSKGETVNHNFY